MQPTHEEGAVAAYKTPVEEEAIVLMLLREGTVPTISHEAPLSEEA